MDDERFSPGCKKDLDDVIAARVADFRWGFGFSRADAQQAQRPLLPGSALSKQELARCRCKLPYSSSQSALPRPALRAAG